MEPTRCGGTGHQWSDWFMPKGKMRRIRKCMRAGCLAYQRAGSQPPELEPIFFIRGFHLVNDDANGASLTSRLGDEIEIELWSGSLCSWECQSPGCPYLELIGVGADCTEVLEVGEGKYNLTKFRAVKQGAIQIRFVEVDYIQEQNTGEFCLDVKVI